MIEAVVQVGPLETRYMRAGRGPHLLVLGAAAGGAAHRLVGALSERFRVYLPQLPGVVFTAPGVETDGGAADEWLRGVIDGLGLDRPAIVAEDPLREMLLRFVGTDGDRIGQVALLGDPPLGGLAGSAVRGFSTPQDRPELLSLMEFLTTVR